MGGTTLSSGKCVASAEYSKGNFRGRFLREERSSSPIVPGNSLTLSPCGSSSRTVNVNPGQLYYWVIIPGKPWGSTRARKKKTRKKKNEGKVTLRALENELEERERSREFTPPDQFRSGKSIGKKNNTGGSFEKDF